MLKRKEVATQNPISSNIIIQEKGIETDSDKGKIREFVINRYTLKESIKTSSLNRKKIKNESQNIRKEERTYKKKFW